MPPPPSPSPSPAPTEVTGIITELSAGADQSDVTALAVETDDGTVFDLLIDPELDYGFDLAHLFEHRDTGDPVRVQVDDRDGTLYALRIDDA